MKNQYITINAGLQAVKELRTGSSPKEAYKIYELSLQSGFTADTTIAKECLIPADIVEAFVVRMEKISAYFRCSLQADEPLELTQQTTNVFIHRLSNEFGRIVKLNGDRMPNAALAQLWSELQPLIDSTD